MHELRLFEMLVSGVSTRLSPSPPPGGEGWGEVGGAHASGLRRHPPHPPTPLARAPPSPP